MQARVAAAAAALQQQQEAAAAAAVTTRAAKQAAAPPPPPAFGPPPPPPPPPPPVPPPFSGALALPGGGCGDDGSAFADDDEATVAGGARGGGGGGCGASPFADVALTHGNYLCRSAHAGAVAAHVRFVLTPLAAESARLFGGDGACAAAASLPAAQRRHLHPGLLAEVQLGVEATRALERALSGMRRAAFGGALRAVAATASASASAASAPPPCAAWRALMGTELPWETAVRQLVLRFGAGAAFSRSRAAAAAAGACTPAEEAWLEEMFAGQLRGLELVTQVKIVMNELLLVPLDEFLECIGTLVELLRRYSADCAARFSARGDWIQRLMPDDATRAAAEAEAEAQPLVLYRFFGRADSEPLPVRVVAEDAAAAAEAAAAEGARACAM
jgi:hypothetical protein